MPLVIGAGCPTPRYAGVLEPENSEAILLNQSLPPLRLLVEAITGALGRQEWNDIIQKQLLEDIVRLQNDYQRRIEQLDEKLKGQLNIEELLEVMMQVYLNMGRTASTKKRALLRHVAINGVEPGLDNGVELRLFIQAVADFDLAHIDLLRRGSTHEYRAIIPRGDLDRTLAEGLESRGFVRAIVRAGSAYDTSVNIPLPTSFELTALGLTFLEHLRKPFEEES